MAAHLEDLPPPVRFYLGAHRPSWLATSDVSLFVSHRTLARRRALPRARAPWALDSGGFTELSLYGEFRTSARAYARCVQRYQRDIGYLDFASIQDWMVEPDMLRRTGRSIEEHQERSIDSYLELTSLAPEVPWMPVLQGWGPLEHEEHAEAYARRGVDLRACARVGVGSICRRQQTARAGHILAGLALDGLRLHGFGLKLTGLRHSASFLASADSMAWSYHERRERTGMQNRLDAALAWHASKIEPLLSREHRPALLLHAASAAPRTLVQLSLPWAHAGEHRVAA